MSQQKRTAPPTTRHGFSLVELMVVVTITAVLAAIALPTFTGYINRSRASEAVEFLGAISMRQEAYRSEFGGYLQCTTGADITNIAFVPGNATRMRGAVKRSWTDPSGDAGMLACFNTLNISC